MVTRESFLRSDAFLTALGSSSTSYACLVSVSMQMSFFLCGIPQSSRTLIYWLEPIHDIATGLGCVQVAALTRISPSGTGLACLTIRGPLAVSSFTVTPTALPRTALPRLPLRMLLNFALSTSYINTASRALGTGEVALWTVRSDGGIVPASSLGDPKLLRTQRSSFLP